MTRHRALAAQCEGTLVVGTDFADVGAPDELAFNARIAVNLGLPVVLVVSGCGRSASEIEAAIGVAMASLRAEERRSSTLSPTACRPPRRRRSRRRWRRRVPRGSCRRSRC